MSRFLKIGRKPDELTIAEMTEIVRFACCAASLSTQTRGGISSVVSLEEVVACEKNLRTS